MKEVLLPLLLAVPFLLIGIILIASARRIQCFVVRYYDAHPLLLKMEYFYEYVKSPRYIVDLRIIGAVCLAGSALLAYASFYQLLANSTP